MFQKLRDYKKYILPFILAVFLFSLINDSEKTIKLLKSALAAVNYLTARFVVGFVVAYGMSFLVAFLRRRLKMPKAPAIAAAYLLFLGFVSVLLVFIIPMVTDSAGQIITLLGSMPKFYTQAQVWLENIFIELDEAVVKQILDFGQSASQSLMTMLSSLTDLAMWQDLLRGYTRIILNLFFGLVISVYVLIEKDSVAVGAKKLVYALFSRRRADAVIEFTRESNRVFSQFLIGKVIDSLIIGLLSAVAYTVFSIPQAGFFAVLAGVTNMIPYFGPIAGGVITVFILLFYNVPAAFIALAIIVVAQAFDGWFLGPKILGNAVGISPLLTIVAITLGGDLAGFAGIFLGVPAMAVFKTMIYDRFLTAKLRRRREEAVEEEGVPATGLAIYDVLQEAHSKEQERANAAKQSGRQVKKKKRK